MTKLISRIEEGQFDEEKKLAAAGKRAVKVLREYGVLVSAYNKKGASGEWLELSKKFDDRLQELVDYIEDQVEELEMV